MQFISSLFGGSGNTILTMLFALAAVIVLIVLVVWLLKFVFNASGTAVRGRNRRLAVVDTLALDQKRQLLIVRRDDVEHVILVGGPQDVVVETGIPVEEKPAAQPMRRPAPPAIARKPAATRPKAAAPVPVVPAAPVRPMAPAETDSSTNAIARLRDELNRSTASHNPRSLRHTGLLRPVTTQDPTETGQNSDISPSEAFDSAKDMGQGEDSESAALAHDDGTKANQNG